MRFGKRKKMDQLIVNNLMTLQHRMVTNETKLDSITNQLAKTVDPTVETIQVSDTLYESRIQCACSRLHIVVHYKPLGWEEE